MQEIPLIPLPMVLFPGGKLALQVHETRYLDLVSKCLKQDTGLGIVMFGEAADDGTEEISTVGTYARLVDFDQLANGQLGIIVEGEMKFRIHELHEQQDGLMLGEIDFLAPETTASLPEEKEYLAELLESLAKHEAVRNLQLEIDFSDALDVGSRLAELIPCSNSDKQLLLEMDEPLSRLEQVAKIVSRLQHS